MKETQGNTKCDPRLDPKLGEETTTHKSALGQLVKLGCGLCISYH